MRTWIVAFVLIAFAVGCSSTKQHNKAPKDAQNGVAAASKKAVGAKSAHDTIRIANDSLEYEIIIIDPGFNQYLNGSARPRNYYGLTYLETRNLFYVMEWNRRVLDPYRFDPNLYMLRIDYDPKIKYGYEVNYLLYNYFLFFQREYRQRL